MTSSVVDAIASGARSESEVWAAALRDAPEWEPVFSPLVPDALALGLETVYEAYLVHYGRPGLFDAPDADEAVLLGDYLYAHGLVRIASFGEVAAVLDLAELVSLCAYLRAEGAAGDGPLWAATAAFLGATDLAPARAALREQGNTKPLLDLARVTAGDAAVERALVAHAERFG